MEDSEAVSSAALVGVRELADGFRQVVVASDRWYRDPIAFDRVEVIDGRVINTLQGNADLARTLTFFAAGRENRMMRDESTSGPARIPRSFVGIHADGLRWGLPLGVPALVLAIGAVALRGRR